MTAAVLTRSDANWTLVERAQAGDMDAFADIYRRYHDRVYRFIYSRTGSQHLAEDFAGDVFVRALRSIGSVTWQGRDIGAWLTTIARNRIADYYKSARYQRTVNCHTRPRADSVDGWVAFDRVSTERADDDRAVSPDTATLDHLTRADLLTALTTLTDEQRQVILLRFFNDMSVAETAGAMGRTIGAVKAVQYRALRALARDESVQALAVAA